MPGSTRIAIATTDAEIGSCWAVMSKLRPHVPWEGFVERVRRQGAMGYRLLYLEEGGAVRAVAGFRVCECLAWGRFLYVDDLVTASTHRSRGLGGRLLERLEEISREEGCAELHLDSGVQRTDAHRFYRAAGMEPGFLHFVRRV